MYGVLKIIHISCVAISGSLFVLRGISALQNGRLHRHRVMLVLPHAVDTILLASAIGLSIMIQQYPFVHMWLTAKVLALIAYIITGSLALRPGSSPRTRWIAFIIALLTFTYIVSVALAHNAKGILVGL